MENNDIFNKIYLKTNYHTHTQRCHHAIGEDEEYILSAIANNYDLIGFSDHVILPWTIEYCPVRASYDMFDEYINSITSLKDKYKDKIKVLVGFECEWNPIFYQYYKDLLDNKKVDYLILGNHYMNYNQQNGVFDNLGLPTTSKEFALKYIKSSIEALKTGLFKIFAHPDFFMSFFDDWDKEIELECKKMCEVAKQYNVALEINQASLINETPTTYAKFFKQPRYRYPYPPFWEIAKEVGNVIVTNIDAHNPKAFYVKDARDKVFEFAKKLGIEITIDLKI